MADDAESKSEPAPAASTEQAVASSAGPGSREDLLDLAVNFLRSTGKELGLGDDAEAKRREFLKGKGLNDDEIIRAYAVAEEREGQVASTGELQQALPDNAAAPPVPVRNYDLDPRLLQPQLPQAPNRTIVRFLGFLAFWISVVGGASGAAAILCKRIIHPKIAQRTLVLEQLTKSTTETYQRFFGSLRDYVRVAAPFYPRAAIAASRAPEPPVSTPAAASAPATAAASASVTAPAPVPTASSGDDGPPPTVTESEVAAPSADAEGSQARREDDAGSEASSVTAVSDAPDHAKLSDADTPPPPDLSAPLRDSLGELSRTLRRYTRRRPIPPSAIVAALSSRADEEDDDDGEKASLAPPEGLLRSVESFVSMLNTTTYTFPHAPRAFVNPYLAGGGPGGAAGAAAAGQVQADAVAACKSEVRSLKGMLLNRRNFFGTPTATRG